MGFPKRWLKRVSSLDRRNQVRRIDAKLAKHHDRAQDTTLQGLLRD